MLTEKMIEVTRNKVIDRLDVAGKWPTGTWLQQRVAMIKLDEARKALDARQFLKGVTYGNE